MQPDRSLALNMQRHYHHQKSRGPTGGSFFGSQFIARLVQIQQLAFPPVDSERKTAQAGNNYFAFKVQHSGVR